jgi:hypothetical protein
MQNEELIRTQFEVERSKEDFLDFYDFAPVGYLTLSHEGIIFALNPAAAECSPAPYAAGTFVKHQRSAGFAAPRTSRSHASIFAFIASLRTLVFASFSS